MGRLVVAMTACALGCNAPELAAPAPAAAIPARVRVLTPAQYANAVVDLFGNVAVPELRVPGTLPHQFVEDDVVAVDPDLLVQFRMAAASVAREVAGMACDFDCLARLAARAFRRPLEADEGARLRELYDLGGLPLVVEAVLQAPDFIYRRELGAQLTPYALAEELAFLFTDSIPDAELWQAARDGSLARPGVLERQVDRLLASEQVQRHIDELVLQWLDVYEIFETPKRADLFPNFDDDLRASMFAETAQFVHDVLWRRSGSLHELLTSRFSFVDARLAELYGVTGVASGTHRLTGLPAGERAGILTQASLLASLSSDWRESIIKRGVYVHRHFLCTPELGRPPFVQIFEVTAQVGAMTESQFGFYRGAHVYCSHCHVTIDPPGRALEAYDAIGRFRTVDEIGQPVDAYARLTLDGEHESVATGIELAHALATSEQVAHCVVDQLVHHALGRELLDPPTRAYLYQRFDASGRDLVDVLRALATAPAFQQRGAP